MGKFRHCHLKSERRGRTAVLGMTMSAIQVWIVMLHLPMNPGDLGHVGEDSRMAILAAIRHSLFGPGRNVTSPAIPTRRCMGCHSPQAAPLRSI